MAATATNESWKPGPAIAHGSSASTAAAARASRCQGSRAEPTSQASDASAPVAAARTTDGPPPTIAAYAITAGIAQPCASGRGTRASQARPSTAATRRTTLPPETASRCASPDARNASTVLSSSVAVPPSATPVAIRLDSSSPPAWSAARAPWRRRSSTPWMPPRRPSTARERAASVSWTPWRASQVRRSKPSGDGGTGARRPLTSTIAPCCSVPAERSSIGWPSRRAIAELPKGPGRGWPSITSRACSTCPMRARRGSAARVAMPCTDQAAPTIAQATASAPARRPTWPLRSTSRNGASTHERDPERARGGERRARQAGREPRRGHEAELVDAVPGAHSASCGRSDSSLTGPMPLTSSSSSIEPNPPWDAR